MKVLVDIMNVIFISFYMARTQIMKEQGREEFSEKDVPFFLHFFINKMNMFFSDFGTLDICWDGKGSLDWRRSIFSGYKMNREKNKSDPSYKTIISAIPKVAEVLSYYPCRQIEIEKAEGDDVIYALSLRYYQDKILIISSDGDLIQISQYFGSDNVQIFHPIKKIFLEVPKFPIAEEKAIIGDKSDNIPGLYRIGPKTFEKMALDKNVWNKKMSEGNNRAIFETLLKIVDLRQFPFINEILDKEKEIEYNKFQPDEVELFLWENKLKDLLHRWPRIKNDIRIKT